MRACTVTGMHSRPVLEWLLRIMSNMLRPDEIGPAEAAYKALVAIAKAKRPHAVDVSSLILQSSRLPKESALSGRGGDGPSYVGKRVYGALQFHGAVGQAREHHLVRTGGYGHALGQQASHHGWVKAGGR